MENPSQRSFFGVLKTIFQSKTANLLVLLLIVAAVPLTVFVAQQQQEVRQRAEVKVKQQETLGLMSNDKNNNTQKIAANINGVRIQSSIVCECVGATWLPLARHVWQDKDGVSGGCASIGLETDRVKDSSTCALGPLFDYAGCACNSDAKVDESSPFACRKEKGSACGTVQTPSPPPVPPSGDGNLCAGKPKGTVCDWISGNDMPKKVCDGNGSCNLDYCQGSDDCDRSNPNKCKVATCSVTTNSCNYSNDNVPNDPPIACDAGKTCQNGVCQGGVDTRLPRTEPPPDAPNPNPSGDRETCTGCEKDGNEFPQCGGVLHNACSSAGTEADSKNLIMVQKWDCGDDGERWSTTDVTDDSQCGGTGGELPERVPPAPPSGSNRDLSFACGPNAWPDNKLTAKWDLGGGNNCNVFISGGGKDHKINSNNECRGQKDITQFEDGSRITNDGIYALYVSNGGSNVETGRVTLNCRPAPIAPPAACNPSAVNMTIVPDDSTKTEIKVGDNIRFNVSGSQGSTHISEQGLSGFTDCTGGIWGNKICKALKEGQDITWTHNWKNCAGSAANCPVTCAKNAKFTIKSSASAIPACDKTKVTMTAKSVDDPVSSDIFVNDRIKFSITGEQGSTNPQDEIDQNPTGIIDYTNGGYFGTSNFKAQKTGVITWVHKWKNCAGSTSNCSDTVCSSDPVLVNVKPAPNFRVEGVIFNDTDGNKEQGTGETGMPGIIVKLTNEDTNANFPAAASGADGKFVFESIPRGNRYKGEITNIPANNYVTVNYPVRTSIRANVTGFKIGIRLNPAGAKEIKGKLNAVSDCNAGITGYACIPNEASTQLNVDIFDYSGVKLGTARADKQNATSECQGNHKFVFDVPSLLKDGNPHSIYAHAINIINGQNPELTGSPQTFTCANPAELDGEEGINIGDFNVLLSKYKSKENINYCTTSRSNICSYPNGDGFIDLRSFGLWFIDAYPFLH